MCVASPGGKRSRRAAELSLRRAAELTGRGVQRSCWRACRGSKAGRDHVVVFFFTLHYGPAQVSMKREFVPRRDSVLNIGPGSRHLNQPWSPLSERRSVETVAKKAPLGNRRSRQRGSTVTSELLETVQHELRVRRRSGRTRSFAPGEEGSTGARGRRWPPRRSNAECSRLTSEPSSGICSSWCAAGL